MVIDSIATLYKKSNNAENFIYTCLDRFLANPVESNLEMFEQCKNHIWRKLETPEEELAFVILLCNQGFYLTRYGNIYQGIDVYEHAWKIFDEHHLKNFDIIEYCLKPLGNNYIMLGDYVSAGNIIREYLYLAEKEKNYAHIAGAVINLSIIYHDTGNHPAAIEILSSVMKIPGIPEEKMGLIYGNLARNFEVLDKSDLADYYAKLSLNTLQQYKNPESPVYMANAYKVICLLHLRKKDTVHALTTYSKILALVHQHSNAFKIREHAKINIEYAGLLKIAQRPDEAIASYQQALRVLLPAYKPSSKTDLPESSSFYAENAIKESLDGLADLYEKSNELTAAVQCYELSFAVEDILRDTYNFQGAKLQQQVENRKRADHTIQLLFKLNEATKNAEYITKAFQVAERTKAIMLREMAEERHAKRLITGDSLLQRENQLRFKQASVTNELVLEQGKQPLNEQYIHDLTEKQNQLTIEIKSTQKAIEKKYPQYSTYYGNEWLTLGQVQTKLRYDNAVLVEYFSGHEHLFQFIVTTDSIILNKINYDQTIRESILTLNNLFSTATNIHNNLDVYKETAYNLFLRLHLNEIRSAKNVLLVPDGLLHTIPFDALLYEPANGIRYEDFPYMIKKYALAYQPSALLYTHFQGSTSQHNQYLLGMFPVFENTDQALVYSKSEAENIRQYFKGSYLMNNEATKNAFLNKGPDFSIIHLSTHASPGNKEEPPAIYFSDSVLYLPQIYGLHLNADLMVLSACETGVGKLASGEGALSLAHAFQYAGVRNIILSLWKVNDQSTATLFSSFYNHYLESGNKASALQQAKLDYLKNTDIQNTSKSPFYWAAFIYYGDYDTVSKPLSFTFYFVIIGCIALITVVVSVRLKRKII